MTKRVYEVWALGYKIGTEGILEVNDFEHCFGTYDNIKEATEIAEKITEEDLDKLDKLDSISIEIVVEHVNLTENGSLAINSDLIQTI